MMRIVRILSVLLVIMGLVVQAHGAEHPDKLYETGKYEEAQAAYEQLGLDNPKDIRYRYNRGCAAYQNQDYQSALAAFSSVYRRADNDETRFKAVFNLGNSAFQSGDLTHAVEYYRQAIVLDPENEDARYNLEFAMTELEKQKNAQQQQGQDRQNNESQSGQSLRQEGQEGSDQDQNREDSGQDQNQQQGQEQQDRAREQQGQQDQDRLNRQSSETEQSRDLSGDLGSASPMQSDAMQEEAQNLQAETLDKKKAEALLDNVREDRAKFLRLRVPEDKRRGVASGKYW